MWKDLSYAVRNMLKNPGVTAVAVLTLALGIGANTAMFSVNYALLLRPLPLREPDRLVTIRAVIPRLNIQAAFVEYNTFAEWWRARSRSFDSMAAFTPTAATLSLGDQPQRVKVLRVSAGFFSVIGAKPALGRDFLPEEDQPGAARVAMLSDGLWKRGFGSSRGVLGRSITVDNNNYTVVGVLPPDLELVSEDVLTPIAQSTARRPGVPSVGVYARLKRGVSLQKAQADIDALCSGWLQQYPAYPKGWGARVWPLRDFLVRDVRTSILVLEVAVALVLLIACANIANLLLARAGARQREIAVRCALGASRGRIVRQLLTESSLVGTAAAILGLPLAWLSVRALVAAEVSLPFLKRVAVNAPVLGFTVAAAMLTAVLFGLAPALTAARAGLSENLKEGGRTGEGVERSRFRAALVVAEVALSVLLIIGATLTVRSLARLQAVDPGFRPQGVLTASLTLPDSSYKDPARRIVFFRTLLERIATLPGVEGAGMTSHLPFGGTKSGTDIVVEGAPPLAAGEQLIAYLRTSDPDYFRTLKVPLRGGRFFTPRDPSGGPVAIINETMARRCWPGQDPVGRHFSTGRGGTLLSVVGVIGDMRSTSLAEEPDMEYYLPHTMYPVPSMTLVVRTPLDPLRLAPAIGAAVRESDKNLALSDVSTLDASISKSISARRFSVTLLGGFALLALVLAAVGIYGLISYSVTRRTHELGVRIALGADRGRIAGMVVGQALVLGGAGVVIGVGGSLALTRLLGSMLYGVSPTDPLVFTAATLFLLAVSALAAYVPARRAAAVNPIIALRHE